MFRFCLSIEFDLISSNMSQFPLLFFLKLKATYYIFPSSPPCKLFPWRESFSNMSRFSLDLIASFILQPRSSKTTLPTKLSNYIFFQQPAGPTHIIGGFSFQTNFIGGFSFWTNIIVGFSF